MEVKKVNTTKLDLSDTKKEPNKFTVNKFVDKFFETQMKKIILQIFMVIFASFIGGIAYKYFILEAEVISGGVSGIALLIQIVGKNDNLFMIWNILLNIPLFIFAFLKVGRRFALLSSVNIVLVSVFIAFMPNLHFIDDPTGTNRLITVFTGGLILGVSFSILYRNHSSSGGTDFVSTYLSIKKGISISFFATLMSLVIVFTGSIIINSTNTGGFNVEHMISEDLVYTCIGLFTTKLTIEYLYPKFKKIKVIIISEKGKEIRDNLKKSGYPHAWSFQQVTGGMSLVEKERIIIVCSFIERKGTLDLIKEVDPNCFITVVRLSALYGRFSLPSV